MRAETIFPRRSGANFGDKQLVHDKQVRRRRAVLALLVGISLILLTAYFGESPDSPLHNVQRGIVEVLSPVQQGASTVLSPVKDVAGWFSDTLNAKSQRDQLRKQVDQPDRSRSTTTASRRRSPRSSKNRSSSTTQTRSIPTNRSRPT